MIPKSDGQAIFVEAPARLHFGILNLHGGLGRWFGGLGAAAPAPTLLLSAAPAESLEVLGEDADRAAEFARRFLNHFGIRPSARLHVHRALPSHAGLGSGTQLALAVARALAELFNIQADVPELATVMGRACRSAVGTWTFAGGGLVVEGGRSRERNSCGPLLARLPFPSTWQCIVVVPDAVPGLNGVDEAAAFAALPKPPERDVERVAHLVLMALLPALAEADIRDLRQGAERDSRDHRAVVCECPGRCVRERPERRVGSRPRPVRCRGCWTELMGSGRVPVSSTARTRVCVWPNEYAPRAARISTAVCIGDPSARPARACGARPTGFLRARFPCNVMPSFGRPGGPISRMPALERPTPAEAF